MLARIPNQITSIVQAAHIHQHAKSGNDDPRNGLALTPDAHWMFDAGLRTVIPKGDDLLVHVSHGHFSESSPHGRLLSQFHEQPLHFHDHILDHGHKTDILISDGPNFHRIQIKTVETSGENHIVKNRWKGSHCDVVVFFARNSTWGYVTPAFVEEELPLNHQSHQRFEQTAKDFLKAFHKL